MSGRLESAALAVANVTAGNSSSTVVDEIESTLASWEDIRRSEYYSRVVAQADPLQKALV